MIGRGPRDPKDGSRIGFGCLLQLTRSRLSAMVAISALAGWSLHPAPAGAPWPTLIGVFLLAGGATALNQMQERDLDARMLRTRGRPLPAGCLRPRTALLLAAGLLGAGLAALAVSNLCPVLLGVAAAILYNGVYTPLKRRTPFAVLPGALCGALPPLIGWTAAGGDWTDYRILLLAGILFLWQVPHFWLFAEKHREDYRRAGLPLLSHLFASAQIGRLLFAWSASLAITVLALSAFVLVRHPLPRSLALLCAFFLLVFALEVRYRFQTAPDQLFHRLTGGLAAILAASMIGGW